MISYIRGVLRELGKESIIVEAGSFGVEVFVPASLLEKLPSPGEEILLHTYFKVSEDAMQLYGFGSRQDLLMFKQIISVSGIGPKSGLGILSAISPDELRLAIIAEDVKTLSKAPGIGAKTAKRLILDLKDKIGIEESAAAMTQSAFRLKRGESSADAEAMEALVSLGYSASDAARAVGAVEKSEDMDAKSILKLALKQISLF
ncbi:MAG: Holliday junction branch migration protein RuvA [Johnsonella sp.]|nr:Holliday junction branch migration protein RuvA [Johnsonella sp.]